MIVMLVLGVPEPYWRVVAWAIAVPIVALSYRHFVLTVGEATSSIAGHFQEGSRLDRILLIVMAVAGGPRGHRIRLVKGLYPQGGHDYYQHYSQFYAAVIDSHGIWPKLFWYEYYYSKAMGLTFLGMLLTDALAPSLVAYCFAVATALALYSLVRGFGSNTLWPWLAVVLYLALNVHTLGTVLLCQRRLGSLSKAARAEQPAHVRGAVDERLHGALRRCRPPGLVAQRIDLCVCPGLCPARLAADPRAVRSPCRAVFLRQEPPSLLDVSRRRGLDGRRAGLTSLAELPDDRRPSRCRCRMSGGRSSTCAGWATRACCSISSTLPPSGRAAPSTDRC